MNNYITELSKIVPMCHAMPRKLDKLTVLRMAVQHMKTIRGAVHSYTEGHYKPAFLSDNEVKMLILQAADGFLFVVGCDRGRILYVSDSVSQILNYSMGDLLGQSWFDILHPKDVAKVKEQMSSSDLSPRERLIDAKTMLPVKTDVPCGITRLCPGARRSFFCRMKCKLPTAQSKGGPGTQSAVPRRKKQQDRKYSVIQCTGYLKSWGPAKIGVEEQEGEGDGESSNLSCLVAVGRLQPPMCTGSQTCITPPNLRTIQFISRHAMDGKFLFVDQRSTLVLGFLPQELLGTSMYEYYHPEDIPTLAEIHKLSLLNSNTVKTPAYRLRTKDGSFVNLQSEWKSFRNPWTKDVEYLIAKNSVIRSNNSQYANTSNAIIGGFEFFNQSNGREMQSFINTHVESSKIGSQIAEEALETQRREDSPERKSPIQCSSLVPVSSTIPEINPSSSVSQESPDIVIDDTLPSFSQIYNSTHMAIPTESISAVEDDMMEIIGNSPLQETTITTVNPEGNEEADMAVIMSLLEADAGLGGPVDFSGLPWPLL
ncbi:basic helix-loop-helix ARNT-like protein cyc isoform X2 [Arctopsyche grandis]|uniref:basic helix-loop-helix ARNT-like protein cyc isoform X2 n=1 Tax=Arctopsyche grandis TaxID=121162 RepID=UPI00406D825D